MTRITSAVVGLASVVASSLGVAMAAGGRGHAIIPRLSATPTFSASTVPPNGDLNPYGVAFVPDGFPTGGPLEPGDILVSNFNDSANLQGTGTTIVRIDGTGNQSLFFQGRTGLGLTTALGVLSAGFVVVGNVPSTTPSAACTTGPAGQEKGVGQGFLLVLDSLGNVVAQLHSPRFLDGPWDLAVSDRGATASIFVSNVLDGTVSRIDLALGASGVDVVGMTTIASGYTHRCDPAALVVGPTGLALDQEADVLYVASTGDNAIYAVDDPFGTGAGGTGSVVIQDPVHLHGPLGLARASNGDLVTSQGDAVNPDPSQPSEIVEYTAAGRFVAQFSIDPAPGSAFGLALAPLPDDGFVFAAVDDGTNVLDVWVVH